MKGYANDLLSEVRKSLEEEKKEVASRLRALSSQDPFTDPERGNDNADSGSEASEESDHDRVLAQIEQLNAHIASLDGALIRIGNGTYGFCETCKQMIDTDRLAILPTATLCLSCEQKKKK